MNYANADMVGHTGVWDATISALETLDVALGRLEQAVLKAGGILVITSDHGNAEAKLDADNNPLTAHTTNPVPLVLISANRRWARSARRGSSAISRRRCCRCSGSRCRPR